MNSNRYFSIFKFITGVLTKDPSTCIEIIQKASTYITSYRDEVLLNKFLRFFRGLESYDNVQRAKFTSFLMEDDEHHSKAYRFVHYLDVIESDKKIDYIINLARNVCMENIDLNLFFRLMYLVSNTLDEDLLYLKEHLEEIDLKYNYNIQGLINSGIVYCSNFSGNGQLFSFTPLARLRDMYAISYDDLSKYNVVKKCNSNEVLAQLKPPIGIISDEEIDQIIQK